MPCIKNIKPGNKIFRLNSFLVYFHLISHRSPNFYYVLCMFLLFLFLLAFIQAEVFADRVPQILSLDWITAKLFICFVRTKKKNSSRFFLISPPRDATMIERIVNKFMRKLRNVCWEISSVRGQNYYKLWHFYWVSKRQRRIRFRWLLAATKRD